MIEGILLGYQNVVEKKIDVYFFWNHTSIEYKKNARWLQNEQIRKHNELKCRYLGMAATKNNKAYVKQVILGVLISSILLTTAIVLQKQNAYAVYALTSTDRSYTEDNKQGQISRMAIRLIRVVQRIHCRME